MKHLPTLILPALLAALVVAPVAAVHGEPFTAAGLPTLEMFQRLAPALGLTPEQEARMSAALREAKTRGASAEATLREHQRALQDMLRDPAATPAAASDVLARMLEVEGDLKHRHLQTLFALRDILTPAQRQQALELAASKPVDPQGDLESRVRGKVARLQAAVQSLGEGPTEGMKQRGAPIQALIETADWQAADAALDRLIADAELDDLATAAAPDFTRHEPGDTSLDGLMQRLERVKEQARDIVSIATMRRLMKARDALEEAKASEDATAAGRILTFAEQELGRR